MRWMALAVLASCGGKDDPGTTQEDPFVCPDATSWDGATAAFRDASADWGLDQTMPLGVRISAVDFDGDGWPDLAIRSNGPDDPSGTRTTWLLRNTEGTGFEDVTHASGIVANREGGDLGRPGPTWAFGDVDNDGDLDVYTGNPDASGAYDETSEIMLNAGDGTFTLGPADSDIRVGAGDMPYGAAFTDVDRDGRLDLWVANYDDADGPQGDHLYRGRADAVFREMDDDAGIETEAWRSIDDLNEANAHSRAWAALACDLNDDGWPELLASSYGRSPNLLWRGEGDGAYTNESVGSGYAFDDRTDWSDNESARCWCTLNPTDEDCDGVPEPELIACNSESDAFRWDHNYDREPFRMGGNSGGTTCFDADNDGAMDLLTSEIVHWDVGSSSDPAELMFNTGEADVRFERPGNEATGLTREHDMVAWNDGDITNGAFDFDNDGWTDVWIGSSDYEGARGLLFHNDGGRTFSAVPLDIGIDHTRSHGSAAADFDRDGDLDFVVGHSSARCEDDCYDTTQVRLFENLTGDGSHYVQLRLEGGADTNRSAIGARIKVTAGGTTQTHDVDGGHGQWGQQDDLLQHFGLAGTCEAEVEIRWPDAAGTSQTFTIGQPGRYLVKQGEEPIAE
jgi:enediyne biosynthesis protein E4